MESELTINEKYHPSIRPDWRTLHTYVYQLHHILATEAQVSTMFDSIRVFRKQFHLLFKSNETHHTSIYYRTVQQNYI